MSTNVIKCSKCSSQITSNSKSLIQIQQELDQANNQHLITKMRYKQEYQQLEQARQTKAQRLMQIDKIKKQLKK